MNRAARLVVAGACIALWGCASGSRRAGESAPESKVASWVGPDAVAIAGVNLDQVRDGPLSKAFPPEWLAALESFRQASRAWLAYNGKDLLVIAAGRFPPTPSGAVVVGHGLVLAGSINAIQAAEARHARTQTESLALLEKAKPFRSDPIWAVVRGDAPLPLHGNAANLGRALQFTEYTAASVTLDSGIRVRFTGNCATAEKARELEESLRAMVTLGKRAVRAQDLKATLESVGIGRRESTVEVSVTAAPDVLREMLR